MYRSSACSSSSCSYSYDDQHHQQFNSNSSMNSNMYISIQHPPVVPSSFLSPSPPISSYSSSSSLLTPNSYISNNTTAAANNGYLQRSNSSRFLPIYHNHHIHDHFINNPTTTSIFSSSSPSSSSCREFRDFNSIPVRRVFSTGDLQGMNGSQALAENSGQEGNGAVPSKVIRYSAEERKEKIEKYRSKRNQRNFQKKITYACRKTLADSRPRVKGRFARNGEPEIEAENETDISAGGNNYGCFNHGSYNSFDTSVNEINMDGSQGEMWRQIEQAMEADDEGMAYFYDEEMWNSLSDVVPMNVL